MRGLMVLAGLWSLSHAATAACAQAVPLPPPPDTARAAMYAPFASLQWQRIMPELGAGSHEITILHVDPETHATQLMIRVPAGFHVARHWHTANETHTVVSGTFVMDDHGRRVALDAGSFNYMPSHMVHEAWTNPGEGALLFITVDGAWDIHWLEGPPSGPTAPGRLQPAH